MKRWYAYSMVLIVAIGSFCTYAVADESSSQGKKLSGEMRPVIARGYIEEPLAYDEITPHGFWKARMRRSLSKLLVSKDQLCEYFGFGADQIGRWIGSTTVLAAAINEPKLEQEIAIEVDKLIDAQDVKGLFYGDKLHGDLQKGMAQAVWFGQGRAIWNLQAYYSAFGSERVLESLTKAADCIVDQRGQSPVPKNIAIDIESSLGAMAILGQETGRKEYLDYARYVADRLTLDIGKPSEWYDTSTEVDTAEVRTNYAASEHHLHSYLSIAHGIVDLAVITQDKKYLEKAQQIFEYVLPYVWVTGGIPENSSSYYEYNDETCQVVDWIELCLKLYNATGEVNYLDAAELSIFNHLLFDQLDTGSFVCQRSITRHHKRGSHGNRGRIADFCCTMSGPWAFAQVATEVVTENIDGFSINLLLDIDVTKSRNENSISLSQRVAVSGDMVTQNIQVANEDDSAFVTRVRIPYWSYNVSVTVNGKPYPIKVEKGFLYIKTPPGVIQSISINLPMSLIEIPPGKSVLTMKSEYSSDSHNEKSLQYGPFVMMFNRQMYPEIELHDFSVNIPLDSDGNPLTVQEIPKEWNGQEAIPLLIRANVNGAKDVLLTPCANITMSHLTVDDPYVVRFVDVKYHKR